jgi:hypothetical protein
MNPDERQRILDHLPCSTGATMPRTLLTDTGRLILGSLALAVAFIVLVALWGCV